MDIDKVYVVATEENDDGDIYTDVLDGKFYTDSDEARKAMIADFDRTKSDFDECDDIDEWHDLDSCRLSANLMRSFEWEVVELTKGESDMLTETQKIWLTNLLETEIEIEKKTISNERVWENGCDDEFNPHSGNIDEHEGYIEILKEIKEKYCN